MKKCAPVLVQGTGANRPLASSTHQLRYAMASIGISANRRPSRSRFQAAQRTCPPVHRRRKRAEKYGEDKTDQRTIARIGGGAASNSDQRVPHPVILRKVESADARFRASALASLERLFSGIAQMKS